MTFPKTFIVLFQKLIIRQLVRSKNPGHFYIGLKNRFDSLPIAGIQAEWWAATPVRQACPHLPLPGGQQGREDRVE
jgi:hypothetical protein